MIDSDFLDNEDWDNEDAAGGNLGEDSSGVAEFWDYDDADELADAVAGDVAFIIESAIDARGSAVIALAGGKTPGPNWPRPNSIGSG
jgi:hypothetical protein